MATPVWKNVFVETPTVTGNYWIVRLPFFDTPILATFTAGDQFFFWTDSSAQIVNIGFNEVFKWRAE